jgi:hypothetical protein
VAKSVRQRIWDSFEGDLNLNYKLYEERVFSSWKDVSSSLSKSVFLILGLIALFELLTYQNTSHDLTIGSFSFANSSMVQVFLPTIVAYAIYDGCRLTLRWMDLQAAYLAISERDSAAISDNDLDLLIAPVLPAFWAVGKRLSAQNADRGEKFILPMTISLASVTMIIAPLGFEFQAYYHLYNKFGAHNFLLWINVGITALFLVFAVTYMILRAD